MRIIIVLMVLAFSLFSGGRIFANALPALPHSSTLVKGFQALEQGQWELGESLISKAPGSVSAQLFYWKKYSASQPVGKIEWIRISRFIRSHDDWPSLAAMKKNAEAVMPKDLEKSAVITWFQKYSPVSADAKLRYLKALKETKNDAAFRKNLVEYWTKDLFGDRAQAEFLRAHGSILSKSLRNKRLSLLLAHHYYDTASHLASQMGLSLIHI